MQNAPAILSEQFFSSKSRGDGHLVRVIDPRDGRRSNYVTCTCPASKHGFRRDGVCWASKGVARIAGIRKAGAK